MALGRDNESYSPAGLEEPQTSDEGNTGATLVFEVL